jgi:hypothetical protein
VRLRGHGTGPEAGFLLAQQFDIDLFGLRGYAEQRRGKGIGDGIAAAAISRGISGGLAAGRSAAISACWRTASR